jgi:ABC-2 type transport system permease protein
VFSRTVYHLQIRDSKEIAFKDAGVESKMIVVSDGDVIRNHVNADGTYMAVGFDRFSQQMYGNGKFLLNAVNYLCDDVGMTAIRSRALEIRLLDRKRIESERSAWQAVNVVASYSSAAAVRCVECLFPKAEVCKLIRSPLTHLSLFSSIK